MAFGITIVEYDLHTHDGVLVQSLDGRTFITNNWYIAAQGSIQ